jgi:hypothetical protein
MGADLGHLARTAQNAVAAGAPLVDLNFGCPSKGALAGCAGSSLLRDPLALEKVVRAVVDAVAVPVTAKIRAGYDDATRVGDLARAAENGGAALLTVHCRTRAEGYCDAVDWSRIARAVRAVSIPVCGNGGIAGHADLRKDEMTGAFAMVAVACAVPGSSRSQREPSKRRRSSQLRGPCASAAAEPRGVAARGSSSATDGGRLPDAATARVAARAMAKRCSLASPTAG